ncbi:hypothetical protein EW026_g4137 [Hermanssonia centrifuga]|uniref:histidine kinase n=1 Tax=Hermanssonia centrifuga TaxID=98765 RepID=A0A4S4KIG8_9APHY|nr:hypothetical protein EW026_g4137 [Hermanssonia centrifuga]
MSDIQNDPSTGKIRAVEKLEVEDEEKRQQRMHDMFMQLDGKLQTQARETPRTFDFGDRTTFLVEPPIELLSRVQAFLPQFAASNAEIALRAKDDPESVDIEKLGNESSYIQMNLGLGVFEERKTAAGSSASDSDAEMHDSETSAPSSFSDSSLQSDSETSEDSGYKHDNGTLTKWTAMTVANVNWSLFGPIKFAFIPLRLEALIDPENYLQLVVLSFCISWIGAYTSTQLVIHAKYSRTPTIRWLWTFLASVAFGFTAIWSMHFVGMLACGLDVQITLDIPLTIVSAVVAILFTFAAFSSGYASEAIENSGVAVILSKWSKSIQSVLRLCFCGRHVDDLEAGSLPIAASEAEANERRPMLASFSDHGGHNADEEEEQTGHNSRPWDRQDTDEPPPLSTESESAAIPPLPPTPPLRSSRPLSSPKGQVRTLRTVLPSQAREGPNRTSSGRTSEESASTPLTEDSSEESASLAARRLSASSHNVSLSDTTLSSHSWSEPLHAGLSREARIRIKAQSRDRPVPEFGWKYWLKAYYKSITFLVAVRATIWGIAIVFMHYCGMWAMEIPEGRISWDWRIVILSYIVAFTLCFVGCIAMVHMEVHFLRQVAFSTIVAFGCCSMHYTGMWAATFYTRAPPSPDPGYPAFLPFAVLVVAIFVCVISNAVLAHSAILSRNRLAEIIITKRRFWRIMAEKEAAEQANELKQQFISVASHEIRTPLHAVNGYCELLAMTALTEEQAVYVSSIQQACHAINVIAGNVLDFSKLDRNNVELSARPVLVNLRKMAEDQARIIETKGTAHPQPAVDLIVSVASAVPQSLYLDETYTFRILMNLLSNAQKFCEDGYVCVVVSMDSDTQVSIKVSDTGCGIPKSFRNSLFQPFRQADSSLTRPKQGTGLGLSIVKHLVQLLLQDQV